MRSLVWEPMRHGRLFLAGDAAHLVPPTGAKGLNLAVVDVAVLASALGRFFADGDTAGLESYSDTCLARVWRVQHFSWWMTSMLHRSPDGDAFTRRLQLSQLRYLTSSTATATSFAENYVGLPFPEGATSPSTTCRPPAPTTSAACCAPRSCWRPGRTGRPGASPPRSCGPRRTRR